MCLGEGEVSERLSCYINRVNVCITCTRIHTAIFVVKVKRASSVAGHLIPMKCVAVREKVHLFKLFGTKDVVRGVWKLRVFGHTSLLLVVL